MVRSYARAGGSSNRAGRTSMRLELCSADEVAEGAALKVEAEGLVLAVFNVEGMYFVMDDAPASFLLGSHDDD